MIQRVVRGTNDQTISDVAMTKITVKLCSGASKDNDNNNNNGDRFRKDIFCFPMRDFQRHCSLFSLCSETSGKTSVLARRRRVAP